MPFVNTFEMLQTAQKEKYAVGSFNIENMEMAQAVVSAAEKMQSPVILATTSSTIRYAPPILFCAIVRSLADAASVPVAMHLDHGDNFETVDSALISGYSSVMIDGSKLNYDDNIALTRRCAATARLYGIPLEAELGRVGGKEDNHEGNDPGYTDPTQVQDFVAATGANSLAVAIGTAHGVYLAEPHLDVERLIKIRDSVDIPLVLHGSSGLSDAAVRECIGQGICKVNYATELRQAFTSALRESLVEMPSGFDPKVFLNLARAAVAELVCRRIENLGSCGKAR